MSIHLETLDNQTRFRPGDAVSGIAGWELGATPESVEVCLFWHTSGKGDRDVGIVDRVMLTPTGPIDAQPYRLQLPAQPYSFSGTLMTLTWSIELIVEPDRHVARIDLTVSPSGEAVALGSAEELVKKSLFRFESAG